MTRRTTWTEAALISKRLHADGSADTLEIRLGFPKPTEYPDEWACAFQLVGLKDDKIHLAHGVDGVQALLLAAGELRRLLERTGKEFMADGVPYEFILPRYIPISYGLTFHRQQCQFLENRIEEEESRLSRRRLALDPKIREKGRKLTRKRLTRKKKRIS